MSTPLDQLSRREREFYQILCSLDEATAIEIQQKLPDGTKNSATRKILTALLKKGVITRRKEGRQYIYAPEQVGEEVGKSALNQVLDTFFNGSLAHGLLGMVDLGRDRFTKEELEQIRKIVKDKS
ncbi:MAG: BlaI/MecI/CopY family transcriptional regulator [Verrucomicrobiaceae bacterium]